MIIGLTGLIGSGKSEVAGIFGKMGAIVIDADLIGRQVVDGDSVVFYRLLTVFGTSILNADLTLNRKRLGQAAFSSPAGLRALNEIIHPPLLRRLDNEIAAARRLRRHAVVDAALLVQWKYDKRMDHVILVTSTAERRLRRMGKRGFDREEVRRRSRLQLSEAELKRHADMVMTNDGDLDGLRVKAEKLYRRLTGIS